MKVLFLVFIITTTCNAFGFPYTPRQPSASRMRTKQCFGVRTSEPLYLACGEFDGPIVLDEESTLLLPIFPLRKSVRVPTDSLTLNLYEERYLEMSEYILEQNVPLFGALYSSDKPQLIKGGVGPIIPILQAGDLGVVCFVQNWEEEMVPPSQVDPTRSRRRIRLNAIAVARFRIEKVVYDGTIDAESNNPPFILVEASMMLDHYCNTTTAIVNKERQRHLEEALRSAMQKRTPELEPEEGDEKSPSDVTSDDTNGPSKNPGLPLEESVERVVCSLVSFKDCDQETQRAEVFSFAAASALCPGGVSPKVMSSLLQMGSTQERLQRIARWI
jgi:Lon protease-like protein